MNYYEKTISGKHIYRGNIIDVEMLTVTLPDGREATRDIVRHPGAAAVIPLNEKGEIYMVRQYRKPLEAVSLEIPAGKLDKDEDPAICAARELKEETGLTAEKLTRLVSVHNARIFGRSAPPVCSYRSEGRGKLCGRR